MKTEYEILIILLVFTSLIIWAIQAYNKQSSDNEESVSPSKDKVKIKDLSTPVNSTIKEAEKPASEKPITLLTKLQQIEKNKKEELTRQKEIPLTQEKKVNTNYKSNWIQFQNHLLTHNIKCLYHFTDRSNLLSIKNHGALYSWHYCERNNIIIPMPGSDELSRSLDLRDNLENYVRTSFTSNHPMMYIAIKQNRIYNPVILEIDLSVIYWKDTYYSDKNATRNDARVGSELQDFQNLRFEIVKNRTHFDLDEADKPYYQAEVLILEKVPIAYIKNIHDV